MRRIIPMMALVLTGLTALTGCPSEGDDVEAPEVSLDVRSEETYRVGEDIIRIQVTATDPQGYDLEFSVIDPPSRASFQTFANSAVFTWDPISSDVTHDEPKQLVFAVTNERGATTERAVTLHIHAGNTTPRFLNSTSELYNPTSGNPLKIDVRVRDDDSPQVILSMPPERAPEGASFEQTDNFEGEFRWMPSPIQLEERMHTVVFIADDDDNEPVEQRVTIIIQRESVGPGPGPGPGPEPGASCEDEPIDHQPLQAQRTAEDYRIEGSIANTSQNWEEALVYWTLEDPMGSEPRFESRLLELEGNDFTGHIPNPLVEGGSSEVLSYTICAISETQGDDGFVCSPQEFYYRFVAYAPDEEKCRDDGISFGEASPGEISLTEWEGYQVCEGVDKYHTLELFDGEVVEVAVSFSPGLSPEIEASFDGVAVEWNSYECLGWASVELEGPGTVMVQVSGDDFPYHITGFAEAPECPGSEYEPNNTPGQATLVAEDFAFFENMAICTEDDRDVYALELVRGDDFYAFMDFVHAEGDLDMTLFAPSQVTEVVENGFGVAQGWSSSDGEEIVYVAEESGFHYLSVVTSSEPNGYDLIFERSCEVDDNFSGNHSKDFAAFIELTEFGSLKLCEGQSDWFAHEYEGSSTGAWLGEVRPHYGNVNALNVTVYDEAGNVVQEGETSGNSVDFSIEPQPGETYYFEVHSDRPMIYDLTVLDFS